MAVRPEEIISKITIDGSGAEAGTNRVSMSLNVMQNALSRTLGGIDPLVKATMQFGREMSVLTGQINNVRVAQADLTKQTESGATALKLLEGRQQVMLEMQRRLETGTLSLAQAQGALSGKFKTVSDFVEAGRRSYLEFMSSLDATAAAELKHVQALDAQKQKLTELRDVLKGAGLDAEAQAAAIKKVTAAYDPATLAMQETKAALAGLTAEFNKYRADLGLINTAELKFVEGKDRLQKIITELGVGFTEGTQILAAYAQKYDPVILKEKELAAAGERLVQNRARLRLEIQAEQAAAAKVEQSKADAYRQAIAAIDPLAAIEQRRTKLLADLKAGQSAAKQSTEEYNAAVRKVNETLNAHRQVVIESEAANQRLAAAGGMSRNSMLMLNASVINTVQSLSAGLPVTMVLMQQVPQLVGAFAQESTMLTRVTSAIAGVVGGHALLVTGIAASIGGFIASVAAQQAYASSMREMTSANQLMGGSLGLTTSGLAQLAEVSADAGDVSARTARTLVSEYTKAGGIGASMIGKLISISKDFAEVTGSTVEDASKQLSSLFSDPAKGAEELTRKIGLLNAAELAHIRVLADSGQKVSAQNLLFEKLNARTAEARENVSGFRQVWDTVTVSISNAVDAYGKYLNLKVGGGTTKEKIDELLPQVNDRTILQMIGLPDPSQETIKSKLAALQAQYLEELKLGSAKAAKIAENQASVMAKSVADGLLPVEAEVLKLTANQNLLKAAFDKGGPSVDLYGKALEALKFKAQALQDPVGEIARKVQLQISVLQQAPGAIRDAYAAIQAANESTPGRQGQAPTKEEVALVAGKNTEKGITESLNRAKALEAVALAQRELNAAQVAGNPTEVARATLNLQVAQERANGSIVTGTEYQQRLNVALGQAGVQYAQLSLQQQINTNTAELTADAAGLGAAAMRMAAAEAAIYAASMKGLGEQELEYQAVLEDAKRTEIHNEFARAIEQEILLNQKRMAGYRAGGQAIRDAETYTEAFSQTLNEVPYPQTSEELEEWNKRLQDNIALINGQKASTDSLDFSKYQEQLRENTRQLQVQQSLIGATPETRANITAQEKVNALLRQRGLEYAKLTGAAKDEVDQILAGEKANARLEQSIQHQQDSWNELGDMVGRAFDRLGDALVDVFVRGEGKAVNWGNVTKAIISSLITDLLKMAAINPLRNAMTGGSAPTLWSALSGGDASVGPAGSGGYSMMNSAGQIVSMGQSGYSMLSGSGASQGAAAANWVATSTAGQHMGLSTAMYTDVIGGEMVSAPIAAGYGNTGAAVATPAGAELTSMGSSIGYAAPYAAIGGYFGGKIGTASNSYAAGGLSGAAIGVGSMAVGTAAAGAAGISAAGAGAGAGMAGAYAGLASIPVYGWIAAAVLAAVMAIAGTQKKKSYYAGAFVDTDEAGTMVAHGGGGSNMGAEGVSQRTQLVSDIVNMVAKQGGMTLGGNMWIGSAWENGDDFTKMGGWEGPTVSESDSPARIALDTMRYMIANTPESYVPGQATTRTRTLTENVQTGTRMVDVGGAESGDVGQVEEPIIERISRQVTETISNGMSAAGIPFVTMDQYVKKAIMNTKATTDEDILKDLDAAITYKNVVHTTAQGYNPFDDLIKQWVEQAKKTGAAAKEQYADFYTRAVALELDPKEVVRGKIMESFEASVGLGKSFTPLRGADAIAKQTEINLEALKPTLEALAYTAGETADFISRYTQKMQDDYHKMISNSTSESYITVESTIDAAFKVKSADVLRRLGLTDTKWANSDMPKALEQIMTATGMGANDLRYYVGQLNTELNVGAISQDQYNNLVTIAVDKYKEFASVTEQAAAKQLEGARLRLQTLTQEENKLKTMAQREQAWRNSVMLGDLSPLNPKDKLNEAERQYKDLMTKALAGDTTAADQMQSVRDTLLQLTRAYYATSEGYVSAFDGLQTDSIRLQTTAEKQLSEVQKQTGILQGILNAANTSRVKGVGETFDPWTTMVGNVSVGAERMWGIDRGYGGVFGQGGYQSWIDANGLRSSYNAMIGGYASGTDYATPGLHWVGENGPELLNFRGGEQVISADNAKRFAKVAANDRYSSQNVVDIRAGGSMGEVAAAIDRLGTKLDTMRNEIYRGEGAAQGQRNNIALDTLTKLGQLVTEVQELPKQIAGALPR